MRPAGQHAKETEDVIPMEFGSTEVARCKPVCFSGKWLTTSRMATMGDQPTIPQGKLALGQSNPQQRGKLMKKMTELLATVAAIGIAAALSSAILISMPSPANAQQAAAPAIDNDDIGGVVTGPNGPEAGVWVIAETVELPTKFAKMVVTDDQGRYVIPDLPAVNYSVFVRGYGLVDLPKNARETRPASQSAGGAGTEPSSGGTLLSRDLLVLDVEMMPSEGELGGKQIDWLKQMKNIGCIGCHQIGQEATRTIPAQFGQFKTGEEAWMRRLSQACPARR